MRGTHLICEAATYHSRHMAFGDFMLEMIFKSANYSETGS